MGKLITVSAVGVLVGAILVTTVGIVGWVVIPKFIKTKIKETTRLTNENLLSKWSKLSVEDSVTLGFYIFNITNPKGLLKGEKLKFVERGPYVFKESREKDVNISRDKAYATYRERKYLYFDPSSSVGSDDDVFNVPNIPLIGMAHVGYATKEGMDLKKLKLFLGMLTKKKDFLIKEKVTVRELLIDGWQLNKKVFGLVPPEQLPPTFRDLKFSLLKGKNGTDNGEFVVRTGHSNSNELGRVVTWNGKKEVDFWYTEGLDRRSSGHYCNKINGSDGSLYPPFVTKETVLRAFSSDLCRSVWLTFNQDVNIKGIPAYRFTFPDDYYATPENNPHNRCFSKAQSPKLAHTPIQGLQRAWPCVLGAPLVFSPPHFYRSGPEASEGIEIEPPQPELHEMFLDLEPTTGFALRGKSRLQLNIELQHLPDLPQFKDLNFTNFTLNPSIFLPIVWMEETFEISDSDGRTFYNNLVKKTEDMKTARWAAIVVGYLVAFVSGIFFVMAVRRIDRS